MGVVRSLTRLRRRQREAASLCLRAPGLLRWIINRSQGTFLGPYVTPQTFEMLVDAEQLASGEREYADGAGFFTHFPGMDPMKALRGKRVLDLGCGYGGRTVWYADNCAPASIAAVEISEVVVARCHAFARRKSHEDIDFRYGFGENLPFDDDAFDVVISYDVQEHVDDPAKTLQEIARVLAPDGNVWIVFPTYLGARSSHLDYVTQVPFIHRIFDPETIIRVINEFLESDAERYGVHPQPPARITPTGRRALPALNGSDRKQSLAYIAHADLHVSWFDCAPLITRRAPFPLARLAERGMRFLARHELLPDLLISHLAFHLQPASAPVREPATPNLPG